MAGAKERNYECTSCGEKFFTQHFLQSHVQRVHKDILQYSCDKCHQRFTLLTTLSIHKDNKKKCNPHNKIENELKQLKTDSVNNNMATLPSDEANSNDANNDDDDGDKLIMESIFSKHIDGVKYWICKFCNNAKLMLPMMVTHVAKHLGKSEKKHKCNECEGKFKTARHLRVHKLVHDDTIRPFKCKYCDHTFRVISSYIKHMSRHVGYSQCCCLQCGKLFTSIGILKRHTTRNHAF